MAARVRTHDWSATPLGPIDGWPHSLRAVVGMMVAAPNPMVLLWGDRGTLIYNDGYARFAGQRHPELLGMGAREGWPEIADFNDLNIRRALNGEAWSLKRQELTLDRQGSLEPAWMDLDYTPVPDDSGRPAGLMVFVSEVTDLILAERRQADETARQTALIALDDALSQTDDPGDMAEAAAGILGRTLGADRVGYGVIDPDRECIDVVRDWRAVAATPSVVGLHNFRDYGIYVEDIVAGRPVTIDDVRSDPRTRDDPLPLLSYGVAALMDAPLQEAGRTVAQLLVHSATPRAWTAAEVAFTRAFGERTRAAIARREAERDAARRQAELQRLTDSLTVLVSFVDRDHRYQLSNRAYTDWFGPQAASLVGRPLVEVLGEAAYAKALPRIEAALAGETLSFEDYLPYAGVRGRHIRADYVPRRDETGAVDGFYAVVSDISERKQAELRQQALVEIGDAMRDVSDPALLAARAAEVLGRHLKADRVGYATVNTAAETILVEQDWVSDGATTIAGTLRLRDWGDFIDEMKMGTTLRIDDVRGDPRAEGAVQTLEDAACRAFINVPILEGGDLVAMIFVNQADARIWSGIEVQLVEQAAARIRTEIERARATQALAENEARLRFLDTLFQATAELTDPDAILAITTRMTAEHLGVSNCAYADMDDDEDGFTIRDDWAAPGSTSIVGHYRLKDFGARAVADLGSGRPLIVADVEAELPAHEAAAFKSIGLAATICMPLVKQGRLTALMAIHHREPHAWTSNELALLREVTERSWANIERVRSQAALSVSEDRYRRLFDIIDEGFCVIEFIDGPEGPLSDYVHIEANPAYTLNAGIPDIVGKRLREIVGDEADSWLALYKGVLETGRPIRFEKELEETGRWLELAAFRVEDPGVNQVAVLFKDLTARKRAEIALRQSEAEFRALSEAVPNHVWASRPDGELYWYNAEVYAYTGRKEPELNGIAAWSEVVHPDDRGTAAETWSHALATGEIYRTAFRIRRHDGVWRWFAVRAEPVRDAEGVITGWVGANSDIDDIRRQGEELSRVNDQLGALLAGSLAERDRLWTLSADMLARADYEGGMSAVNPAWTKVLGWSEAELLTNPYADIIHPDDVPATTAALMRMGETGQSTRFENRILTRDKVWTPVGWTVVPEPDGLNFIAVGRDLTEDKARAKALAAAEEALRQSQKMEAIGQLTGGIAHDFNNLLAGISGSLELIEKRMAEGRLAGMERYIQAAQGASRRAATLTQRLLAFSRRQTLDPKPTDVNRLVTGMEDLIRRSVGPNVEVQVNAAADLWSTRIDPSQLENALLNLCINSRDAMAPDGGHLTIRTYNVTLDASEARFRDLPPGDYVKMSVTDTGSGMPPDVIAKAFDPFFTTKPLGQGTGLGLSMIHGFMRQSGGQVRIESQIGQGTTVTLALPRWHGTVDEDEQSVGAASDGELGQGETVLVIDDEETVRMLVVEVLEDAGYVALQAADGPAGLAILNSDTRVDLLISDVGLPGGMNGRQVADAARAMRPGLKVLFITGYAENAVVAGDTLEPGMAVMTKPFQVAALGTRIREMIEG